MKLQRRRLLLAAAAGPWVRGAGADEGPVRPGRSLHFPRDFGAHAAQTLEWWYLTGLLEAPSPAGPTALGVQLTFFRRRTAVDAANPSAFAAHELILGHVALADPRRGALLQGEHIARAGLGLAGASAIDTDVTLDHWALRRDPLSGVYEGHARTGAFALDLRARPTQPVLLQGEAGYSAKEPAHSGRVAASYYYSEPQLALQVRLALADAAPGELGWLAGRGWLDHEWSDALLPARAGGWDWGGFNLDDGGALTVFQVRAKDGGAPLQAYAALRPAQGPVQRHAGAAVQWSAQRLWQSPRSRARYPVAQLIGVAGRRFETRPLMDDQEFDARAGSGIAYWEGACELWENGRRCGSGYQELTGYAGMTPASG